MICVNCMGHAKGLELGAVGRVPLCTQCFIMRLFALPQGVEAIKRIVLNLTGCGVTGVGDGNGLHKMPCLRCGQATEGVTIQPGSKSEADRPAAGRATAAGHAMAAVAVGGVRVPLCAECGVALERVIAFRAGARSGRKTVQGISILLKALKRVEPERW